MGSDPEVIEAAGGVLWRPATGFPGVEVALVHRPKYDDWSVPKGKLRRDEHPLISAQREVLEETGFTAPNGRTLTEIH
jgi:8-oxo-dGTP pyrophosphatase MutT (NUDIX family)